jgi:hypothetical protein
MLSSDAEAGELPIEGSKTLLLWDDQQERPLVGGKSLLHRMDAEELPRASRYLGQGAQTCFRAAARLIAPPAKHLSCAETGSHVGARQSVGLIESRQRCLRENADFSCHAVDTRSLLARAWCDSAARLARDRRFSGVSPGWRLMC